MRTLRSGNSKSNISGVGKCNIHFACKSGKVTWPEEPGAPFFELIQVSSERLLGGFVDQVPFRVEGPRGKGLDMNPRFDHHNRAGFPEGF